MRGTRYFLVAMAMCSLFFLHITMSSADAKEYTPGFKIYQYDLRPGDSVADNPIPPTEFGSFTAKKSEYSYLELIKTSKILADTSRLYRAIGYLHVDKPGKYTIILHSEGIYKYGSIFINKKLAISGNKHPLMLAAPANFSKPGIYEIDIRIYTNIDRRLNVSEDNMRPKGIFNIMIKTPESDSPLPAHKILLLPLR